MQPHPRLLCSAVLVLLVSACGDDAGNDTSNVGMGGSSSGTAGTDVGASGGTSAAPGHTSSGGTASTVAGGLLEPPITTCTLTNCRELLGGTLEGKTISIRGTGAGMSRWLAGSGWMVAYNFSNGGFALLEGAGDLTASGAQTITRGVLRLPNEQPEGGTWYCVGSGTVTEVYTLLLTGLSRIGNRKNLPETRDSLKLIQTWDLLEPTHLEGTLDGKAFTATEQWGGSGPTITAHGFVDPSGQSGYFWSWLLPDQLDIAGIYDGAAVLMTPSGYQVRLGGAASSAYSEPANDAGRDGQRVIVDLKNLIGPLNCPGTDVSGSLSGVVYE